MNTRAGVGRLLVLLNAANKVFEEIARETDDPDEGIVEAADHLENALALLTKVSQS